MAGGVIAVGIAYVLRGPGGGTHGTQAAEGTLGTLWAPRRTGQPVPEEPHRPAETPAGPPSGEQTGHGDG